MVGLKGRYISAFLRSRISAVMLRNRNPSNFLFRPLVQRDLVLDFLDIQTEHIHRVCTFFAMAIFINLHQSLHGPIVAFLINLVFVNLRIKMQVHLVVLFVVDVNIVIDNGKLDKNPLRMGFIGTLI